MSETEIVVKENISRRTDKQVEGNGKLGYKYPHAPVQICVPDVDSTPILRRDMGDVVTSIDLVTQNAHLRKV